jgi:hypothetical protein
MDGMILMRSLKLGILRLSLSTLELTLWVITLYGELVSYFFAGSKSAIGDL